MSVERTIQLRPDSIFLHFKGHVIEYAPDASAPADARRLAADCLGDGVEELARRGRLSKLTRRWLEEAGFTVTEPAPKTKGAR